MKPLRNLLRDRVTAGLWVALIAAVLLFQGVLGAVAAGAMSASASDPLNVICSDHGINSVSPGQDGRTGGKPVDCPCAMLCRLAATAMPAVLGEAVVAVHPRLENAAAAPTPVVHVVPPQRRDLASAPRAPPSSLQS